MKKGFILFFLGVMSVTTYGQIDQIVGDWKTVDDKTGNQCDGADYKLDPERGKTYYAKAYLQDRKLILWGSLDKLGFLGRNQTWLPAN